MKILAPKIITLFKGDSRRVMKQSLSGYNIFHEGVINQADWELHLEGEVSAAIYLLNENANCSTMCFDVDIPKLEIPDNYQEREKVKKEQLLPLVRKIINYLTTIYLISPNSLLVEDTGGRGYHIWLFFEFEQDGLKVVNFLNEVKMGCELPTLEIFPPANKFGRGGFSKSLVRLPLGLHKKYNNARSTFIDIDQFKIVAPDNYAELLENVEFSNPEILDVALTRYDQLLSSQVVSYQPREIPASVSMRVENSFVGNVGEMQFLCPAINGLINKAEKEKILSHNERFALAAIFKNYEDGEATLHTILSNCTNYDEEKSSYQLKSIQASPLSCKTLQSQRFGICKGWCNARFADDASKGKNPSPVWLSQLNVTKEEVSIDAISVSLRDQIASLNNLHHAWKQAVQQSVERDIFEDKLAFKLFEDDLWNNLEMLHYQLINSQWKHNNFLLIQTPKNKEENTFRPFCSVSPREAIVELAILNIIGPPIDSMFNKNSLGNRLAISPKVDNQIFQDWRKQNRFREFKKKSFANFEEGNHYVITDLKKFYEFIKHDKLLAILKEYVDDQYILELVQQYIEVPWERATLEYGGNQRDIGIPQGPALSAFLANLYISSVDDWLEEHTIDFVRYVDDIVMVFDSKDLAVDCVLQLEKILDDLGLTMSKEKTSDPTPVEDNEKLINWLDEIRYDFVKSTKTNTPLTELEKFELFATLQRVAGDVKKDIKTITRYLGLYIRFTERLDDKDKLKTVYATAAYLLIEDRPKHNATCIAVQSLIKACSDYDADAWEEFAGVYGARVDEYFRLVLCQEVSKIIEENNNSETAVHINAKILLFIQAISTNETQPVAAAAALNVLALLSDNQLFIQAHQVLAFSQNHYLRPRAVYFLNQVGRINSTSLARLSPETLLELEVFIYILNDGRTEIFRSLIVKVKGGEIYQLALPYLVRKGVILQEKGISEVWNIIPQTFKSNVAYYIANKVIAELPVDIDRSIKIDAIIRFIIEDQLSDIGSELYRFARYANIMPPDSDPHQNEQLEQFAKESIEKLPTPEGITLINPVVSGNYYVQFAQDQTGNAFIYEHIDERELNKVGGSLNVYFDAMQRMMTAKMMLPASLNRAIKNSLLIILTPVQSNTQSLHSFLQINAALLPKNLFAILEKTVTLIEQVTKLFGASDLNAFIPIPSLHTIFIDADLNLSFGIVSLTIGSEKRYISKSGQYYHLQADDIFIEALGLLFFELTTNRCVIDEIIRSKTIDKENLQRFNEEYGIIFIEIIRKATKPIISDRYATMRFLIMDVSDWSKLETVILNHEIVSASDALLLRIIWNLEIFIHRRVVSEFRNNGSILVYAHQIQKSIIGNLMKHDIHRQSWLWDNWTVIADKERFRKHLGAYQAIVFGDLIEKKVDSYHKAFKLEKNIDFPLWLYASAVHIELESLRRGLHKLVLTPNQIDEFKKSRDFVLENLSQNIEVSLFLDKPNDRLVEATNLIKFNLGDIFNRLDFWLSSTVVPPANWIHDNLLILTLVISKRYGVSFVTSDGETVSIKSQKRLFNSVDFLLFIQELLSVIKSDIANNGKDKPVNGIRYAVYVQGRLREVNLQILRDIHRYFDLLDETVYMKFRLRDSVTLKIRSLKKPFPVNKEIIVEENHNHEDFSLTSGCPYSLDIEQTTRKKMVPLIASFPIVTGKWQDEKTYPIYATEKYSRLNNIRLKYQRKYPITSAFIDVHFSVFLLTPLIFWVGVQLFTSKDATWGVLLNGCVYVILLSPLFYYFKQSYKRLNEQNPEIKILLTNFTGKENK